MTNKELLDAAIKNENGIAANVARRIGYSKVTICQIRAGKYLGNDKAFFAKLRKSYDFLVNGTIRCPGLRGDIHIEVCRSYREAVRDSKTLKGTAFALVKDMCKFCPIGGEK
jgi:hypothetical protein